MVRRIPKKTGLSKNFVKEQCVEKFLVWWPDTSIIKGVLQLVTPQVDNALKLIDIDEITNSRNLANLLYDLIGEHFIFEIHGDINKEKTKNIRRLILDACIRNNEYTKHQILSIAKNSYWTLENYNSLHELVNSNARNWLMEFAKESQLPLSVSQPPQENEEEFKETETIPANIDYKPLYDYQYTAGLKIRQILEADPKEKRMLLSIPTGSGKTRLMVEALINWLDYGKENSPPQQKNSKFIIWIAQSHELCEQAIDAFKSLYKIRGKRALTIHRFFGTGGAPPPIDLENFLNDNGIIVATIHSFNKLIPKNNHATTDDIDEEGEIDVEFESDNPLLELAKLTSCIVIDEAHKATSKMYTRFLAGMGFNFRKNEPNSNNIGLFGLTATPFRGTGVDFEGGGSELTKQTITLRNRFGGKPYYPEIYADIHEKMYKPIPIIDSPNITHVDESTRISGDRSFDNEGVIMKYLWQITYLSSATELYSSSEEPLPNPKTEKSIDYRFPKPGTYKIQLKITNNEGIENSVEKYIDVKIPEIYDTNEEIDHQKILYRRLITRKILCEVYHEKIKLEKTQLSRDESEKYIEKGEYQKQTLDERGKNFDRNKLILEIIQKLRKFERRKILVFACNIEHARLLATVLKAKYGINAEYLDSKVNVGRRIEIIEKFKKDTDDINVLCNVDILTTGFDAPNIDCVFVTRPAKSTVLYTQMIGRGMRGTRGGGTPSMWLIDIDDNFQLHYDFNKQAKLGWKVFQDEWKSLSELGVNLVEKSGKSQNQKELLQLEQMVIEKEVEEKLNDKDKPIQWACIECGYTAIGVTEIQKFFGVEGDPKLLIKHISENNFQDLPKRCYKCRMKVANQVAVEQVVCPYVEFMKSQKNIQGNYQMVFGLFLIENQIQGYNKFDIDQARLYLQKYNPGMSLKDIPKNHSVFDVYRNRGLILDNYETSKIPYGKPGFYSESYSYAEIEFKKILQPDIFKQICIKKIEEYDEKHKEELSQKIDSFENKEDLELAKQLDEHYKNMKKQLGHVPTTHQFRKFTPDKLSQIMTKIYYPKSEKIKKELEEKENKNLSLKGIEFPDSFAYSYNIVLDSNNDHPSRDQNLRDKLYDEYFELYHSVKREISKQELDQYGEYTLEDYDETFVDENIYCEFNEIIKVINKIQTDFSNDRLLETIQKINTDYRELRDTLGHPPHFEEYREKSKIGIEYILNFYGSLGRFKRISDRKENEQSTILHLREEYFKIKKLLKMQPIFTQMLKHCREGLMILEIFEKYPKFLNWLGEPDNQKVVVDEKFKNDRKMELIQLSLKRIDEVGREKTIQLLLEDQEIPYNEWFGSKTSFIEELEINKHDPWIKSTYEKITHAPKPIVMNETMKISKFEQIPKFRNKLKEFRKIISPKQTQKLDKCPKCGANLENLGHAIICANKYCTYYKSG